MQINVNDETTAPKRLVTADAVAEFLGMSKQGLYEAVRRRLVPAVHIGRRIRFDLEIINQWAARGGSPDDRKGDN